jgi:glycosyltransferase involved in cell wall biosynthesis
MNNKKKTFVILSPGFAKNEEHTVCLPAQQVFILAIRNNFPELSIIIIAFEYPNTTSPYQWNTIKVIPFNGERKRKLNKLVTWYKIWRKLKEINKTTRLMGLFSFWCADCALVGKYFARIHRLKHFIWILGQDARRNNRFIKWIRPKASELVAMSNFLAEEFHRNHSVLPAHIIPNGIDPDIFPLPIAARDIQVIGVGSLIPLKQYDLFIQLIGKLSKRNPSVRSMICGKGPQKANLESLIAELNLGNNITLTGELDHSEVLLLMQRSNIFLHTSSYEGFSTVCLEALFAGNQVISFCQPMNMEIPHWHVAKDTKEMLELLTKILEDRFSDHQPVLPYKASDNARELMKLYV